jgi:hypothetical protein
MGRNFLREARGRRHVAILQTTPPRFKRIAPTAPPAKVSRDPQGSDLKFEV